VLFIISGPSGCGKSTLAKRALAELEGLVFSVSHTTRPKRTGEVDGEDYYFLSRSSFEQLIADNKLVEWAEVHGHLYGTSIPELEKKGAGSDVLLDIDVQGAEQIRGKIKDIVSVFILPPEYPVLRERLISRGLNSTEDIERRLETARKEITAYTRFDSLIVNEDLEQAVRELKAVIIAARCRVRFREKDIMPILHSFLKEESK